MNRKRKLIAITIFVIACICMHTNKVEAALQANGGTAAVKNVNEFMLEIRKMQTAGQALGLTDTIDETNLTSTNKNLDIHMQKNTEYGAVILLGASSYGNPEKMNTNGVTTTGNETGVVMQLNKERVIAGTTDTVSAVMKNSAGRYKNLYERAYVEKIGDAIQTVGNWQDSKTTTWLSAYYSGDARRGCILRSYNGSVFSYYGGASDAGASDSNTFKSWDAHYLRTWPTRAVVVVGSGV